MIKRSAFFAVVIGLALASVAATPVYSQPSGDELDRRSVQVYQQVLSPFCPGRSLNDCPSSKAHELKLEMRQQLEQGVPPEVVVEDVVRRFGEQYRAVPQYAGFGKLVWLVPLGFLVGGALWAFSLARGSRTGGSDVKISDDLKKEIEAELAGME